MFQNYPFTTGQVSVGASATLIVAANHDRSGLVITNLGTTDVYIGLAGVTTSTGHLLPGTKGASVAFSTTLAVYGITGGGEQSVSYLQTQ